MAEQKLRLMISSRCRTKFPIGDDTGIELTKIRKDLKKEIEAEKFLGKSLVNVWINETETEDGSSTSWEACIKQASECDMFIALFDGDSGWQRDKSGIGICHAEFDTAYSHSPGKVRVVSLFGGNGKPKAKAGPDLLFVQAVQKADLLEARNFADAKELKDRVKDLVRELVLQLSHEGAREVKKSGPNTGQALDWSRMNFADRQKKMVETLISALSEKEKSDVKGGTVTIPVAKKRVLFQPSAIPAAFTVSAAREMVGQPFLRDHKLSEALASGVGGPVHIIACQKNVTESQAMSLLGFPDATIISGSFGVYVADNIQKIQLCLIANCRDTASTRHALQKLFDWLERTKEDELLAARALSRSKILQTIAEELD
ncbi:hypothetical protein TH9_22100 [Thalassospira xiamenensis]|uniref:DUF4062 domain-containing protein n=1 Tax=Thalassospira xiamenensis TaxID=220697 RepID=UPI000DED5DFF|nr:DUF4062 domain-containing protein [Thalassospira xiamenensis]RCK28749.1 hypothetical protein TH9_22100 [Thalassospira xiamenensis]